MMTLESAMAATVAKVRNGAAFMRFEGSNWLDTLTHINISLTNLPAINSQDPHLGMAIWPLAAQGMGTKEPWTILGRRPLTFFAQR
jgi:hypothetical protein